MASTVDVDYSPIQLLPANSVEYNGVAYDCGLCKYGVCCNYLSSEGAVAMACVKCSCQSKNTVCYYKNNSTCPGSCSSYCNGDCSVNATIYAARKTVNMSCTAALALVNDPTQKVYNSTTIRNVCNSAQLLKCCKGDSSVNAASCGSFWGPTNTSGNCDAIMQNYCNNNKTDPICACLQSSIPHPECNDKSCTNSSAYKLQTQYNNPCAGNYLTCIEYISLTDTAKNNVITNTSLNQSCTQNNNGNSMSSSSIAVGSKLNTIWSKLPVWMWICVFISVLLSVYLISSIVPKTKKHIQKKKSIAS